MNMLDRFVHRENLSHLRKQLAQTTDEMQRQQIVKLVTEEEAKEPPPNAALLPD